MNILNVKRIIEYLEGIDKPKKETNKMTIEIEINLPVARKKRKVTVFNNFVKVGFDRYRIHKDYFTGYEYALIDGKRYEIAREFWTGKGYLVEI